MSDATALIYGLASMQVLAGGESKFEALELDSLERTRVRESAEPRTIQPGVASLDRAAHTRGDSMPNSERRERGLEMIKKVYAGDVVVPPEGNLFTDVMLEQVFAEIWTRDVLSIRDRRLLILGIIAEKGEAMTFGIQVMAALKNGELEPDEVRELMLMIAQYAGYPRAAALVGLVEEQIAEFEKGN